MWEAWFVVFVLPLPPLLFWSFAVVYWKKIGRVATYLTSGFVASYLTCFLLLIDDC